MFEQDKIKRQATKPIEPESIALKKDYGKVPKYLDKFNKKREEAVKQKFIDDENAKLPPGTRLMPEDER